MWRTEHSSPEDLVHQQQRLYRSFYLRPGYVFGKLLLVRKPSELRYLLSSGLKLLRYIYSKSRVAGPDK